MERRHQLGLDSYDRFFPNQDTMPKGGLGNLIALPLQFAPRKVGNSVFIDPDFHPYADQGTTGFSASPVAAAGRLYFASEEGEVYVIRAGPVFEQLAKNEMGETVMATPAVSSGVLYYRTRGHVVAVK
ncbi:MAG: hypothetical protein FJW20_20300 [Acidimicrobiia bacterium]|nr:hypothetical protein [Acidimicrobiia bacterium]